MASLRQCQCGPSFSVKNQLEVLLAYYFSHEKIHKTKHNYKCNCNEDMRGLKQLEFLTCFQGLAKKTNFLFEKSTDFDQPK